MNNLSPKSSDDAESRYDSCPPLHYIVDYTVSHGTLEQANTHIGDLRVQK